MEKLNLVDKQLESLEEKMSGFVTSLDHYVKTIEELQADVSVIKKTFLISKKVNENGFVSLNKSLKIQGISSNKHEFLNDIIAAIAEESGVKITHDNIDLA